MKSLYKLFILFLLFTVCFSCNFSNSQNEGDIISSSNAIGIDNSTLKNKFNYHKILDPQNGIVAFQMPLPKSWKYNSNRNAPITTRVSLLIIGGYIKTSSNLVFWLLGIMALSIIWMFIKKKRTN